MIAHPHRRYYPLPSLWSVMLRAAFALYLFAYASSASGYINEAWERGAHLTADQWAYHSLMERLGLPDHHGGAHPEAHVRLSQAEVSNGVTLESMHLPAGPVLVQASQNGGNQSDTVWSASRWESGVTVPDGLAQKTIDADVAGLPAGPPEEPPPNLPHS